MIIRNPYGFIVKRYKIINLLLLIPMIYLVIKLGDIYKFFNSFVGHGYYTPETSFSDKYVTSLMFGIVVFLIIANAFLYIIFLTKKKNNLIYSISAIYYAVLIVAMLLFVSSMIDIEKGVMESTFANFVRDCALIAYLPIFPLIIVTVAKAVGFNIHTLRFDAGSELKIKDDDDDEIEIKINTEGKSAKKNIVHIIRELKYYFLENIFVFKCIGVVLLLVLAYSLYMNFQVYNKTINIAQTFNFGDFSIAVKDSYISNTDYRGKILADDKYYLAIRIGIENKTKGNDISIDKSIFRIYIGDEVIYPAYDKSARFIDMGEAYQGELVRYNDPHDFIFVYELTKKQVKSSYQMRILNGLSEKNGKLLKNYKKITVKPQNLTKVENLGVVKPNQEISLKKTLLGNSTYKLKKIELLTSYPFEFTNNGSVVKDTVVPSGGNILLVIDSDLNLDESVPYNSYKSKNFYIDFSYINYVFKSKTDSNKKRSVTADLKDVTPSTIKDKKIFEVPSTIVTAEKIDLVIRIRNKYFTISIK